MESLGNIPPPFRDFWPGSKGGYISKGSEMPFSTYATSRIRGTYISKGSEMPLSPTRFFRACGTLLPLEIHILDPKNTIFFAPAARFYP